MRTFSWFSYVINQNRMNIAVASSSCYISALAQKNSLNKRKRQKIANFLSFLKEVIGDINEIFN
ncbi:hypothetical protein NSTCB13_01074 [Nostoc sp. DSM 114160]|jgi:hypothetical protein